MINLWQLHVFLEVAETGSFSAAATRLHMTQPGVSQQIRALEAHLGTQLFVRRGHGVELTASGYELRDPARRMISLSEMTERTLMARRGEVSGRVRLGSSVESVILKVGPWLLEFHRRHPDVTTQIEVMEPGPLLGALRAQELDGGFVSGRIRGRGLVHHKVGEDPITLVVPLNHPWTSPAEVGRAEAEHAANGESNGFGPAEPLSHAALLEEDNWTPAIKPAMLKDQPVVLQHSIGESHGDARRALLDALEEKSVTVRDLRVVLEVQGPSEVVAAVAEGFGIGLVPLSVARRFVGQVVPLKLEGFTLAHHIYLIRDRRALTSPAVAAWWRYIEESTEEPAEGLPGARQEKRPAAAKSARPVTSLTEIKPVSRSTR